MVPVSDCDILRIGEKRGEGGGGGGEGFRGKVCRGNTHLLAIIIMQFHLGTVNAIADGFK